MLCSVLRNAIVIELDTLRLPASPVSGHSDHIYNHVLYGFNPVYTKDNCAGSRNPRVRNILCCFYPPGYSERSSLHHSLKLQRDKLRQYQKKVDCGRTTLSCTS